MDSTPGKRLAAARASHGWTVEDVAHATKIQAARIRDLERDDYSSFPSTTYARHFLLLYARHLGLDFSEVVDRVLPRGGPTHFIGYEFLQTAPEAPRRPRDSVREPPVARGSTLLFLAFVAVFVGLVWFGWRAFERLLDRIDAPTHATLSTPVAASPTPPSSPIPPIPSVEPPPDISLQPEPTQEPEVRRAIPVSGTPPPPASFKVELRAKKRTWIKVITDNPTQPVLYENWLAPAVDPLRFEGSRFWIEILDRNALEITRDGVPVPAPGTTVTLE